MGDGPVSPDKLSSPGLIDNEAVEGGTKPKDVTGQLEKEEEETMFGGEGKKGSVRLLDEDGDSSMDSDDSDSTTTGNDPAPQPIPSSSHQATHSPIPPNFSSIGSPTVPTPQELQGLQASNRSEPQGDAYSDAVKVEGLMDKSESPLNL